MKDIRDELLREMEGSDIIDCHEHLVDESERLAMDVDVFTLFSQYSRWDLIRSGMSADDNTKLYDPGVPLDEKWHIFAPHWENIRYGSFSRASILAAMKFCGVDDIDKSTYIKISEMMKADNKPGLYDKILKDTCGIQKVLNQNQKTKQESSFFIPIMYTPIIEEEKPVTWQMLCRPYFSPGREISSFDEYLFEAESYLKKMTDEGAIAFKICSHAYSGPDRKKADMMFRAMKDSIISELPSEDPITGCVLDLVLRFSEEHDMPVAVHSGYWGDFRDSAPALMIPVFKRYPGVRFDLYHLGMPYVRDVLLTAKNFSNVWVNFCWAHAISQSISVSAVREAVDLVPMNKILAFGGDYHHSVENVYGHLVMAKENIAEGFAEIVMQGRMSAAEAAGQIRKWFWDNPVKLYGLKV
jgi:uncharacterized protein